METVAKPTEPPQAQRIDSPCHALEKEVVGMSYFALCAFVGCERKKAEPIGQDLIPLKVRAIAKVRAMLAAAMADGSGT